MRDAAILVEIPRAQRFVLRQPLATLFAGVTSQADRDACCAGAVRDHGYTMKAVATFLGVHYVTVSRAVARAEAQASSASVSDCKT
jgi:putative transposase